jgi:hypothetical protein
VTGTAVLFFAVAMLRRPDHRSPDILRRDRPRFFRRR